VLDRRSDGCSLFITYATLSEREKVYFKSKQTWVQMRCHSYIIGLDIHSITIKKNVDSQAFSDPDDRSRLS
jgi:hypothetical protein